MIEKIFSFAVMKFIRTHVLAKTLTFLTGLVFLNMSFFLAEVSMLKYDNKDIIENIANLLFNCGFEEERDGESSGDSGGKEIDLMLQIQIHHTASILLSTGVTRNIHNHYRHANYALDFFPPPDVRFLG